MKINRKRGIASMHTFKIKPIRELVNRYCGDGHRWIDPFAGENSPAEFTNDLNPDKPAKYHMEASDFIKHLSHTAINLREFYLTLPIHIAKYQKCMIALD